MIRNTTSTFCSLILAGIASTITINVNAQDNIGYQLPPESIMELVDAPTPPKMMLNEQRSWMLVMHAPRYVDLDMAAYPVTGLAGLRINPLSQTLEAEMHGFFTGVTLSDLKNKRDGLKLSGLPTDLKLGHVEWRPGGEGFAFTQRTPHGLELWYADLQTLTARKLTSQRLNALTGKMMQWHPDGEYLMVQVPANDGKTLPVADRIPHGPVIQENLGKRSATRTFSNLLANSYDEELFDYYVTSQLTKMYLDGRSEAVGQPSIFKRIEFSPGGGYLLLDRVDKPYSYTVGMNSFPSLTEIWSQHGVVVREVSAADTTRPRGRSYQWRQDAPNELVFVKALDRKVDSTYRDGIYGVSAPFDTEPRLIYRTTLQFGHVVWGNSDYAIVQETMRATSSVKWSLINPTTGELVKVIDERSTDDTHLNPGSFVLANGLLQISGRRAPIVHTISTGPTEVGDRPFLLEWDLMKDKRDTLFKSALDRFELPVDYDGQHLFFTRETWNMPPNMVQADLRRKRETPLTSFDPLYPSLAGVSKSLMIYPRKDSVQLSGTLYLPEGFEPGVDEPLPVLVWAYPREYKSAELASRVVSSPHRFTELNFRSAVYWVTRGYAVVDMAAMPIISEDEPNDTFIEQIILNAEALIDHMVDAGIADRKRFGVGGHSYGAFMTANLLAHSDLFAAGIARSGAYNRTLTPFGFQSERRTYWDAKDVYDRMSPFTYADKIKQPLLITHGIDDENSGTFPVQSERLYAAITGHGGTVRLVMFPHEFHGFRARESILHILWEQDRWLEKYVKNR